MDVYGTALADYYYRRPADTLWLHNSYHEPEEMPVDIFFREKADMSDMERIALTQCRGQILDVGAGVGCHSLELQKSGQQVTALEISAMATQIMQQRGIQNIINSDLFQLENQHYDTLLFLMNGIGLTGTINGLRDFLFHAHQLVNPGGQLLFDSSDIRYLYEEGIPLPSGGYYGEIRYQYEYKNERGPWFNWLYVDQNTLATLAAEAGWKMQILLEDETDQYLAQLTRN